MRNIVILLLLLLGAFEISAQNVRLRAAGAGKISVTRGKLRSLIDLRRDTSGCAYVSGAQKRSLDAKGCAAPPASFQLVDATTKNSQTYVVVQTEAMGNCNVCGQCGASESFTLIWLKLDARLRLLEKKAVPIDSCYEDIALVEGGVSFNEETQDTSLKLSFVNNVMSLAFEKKIFNDNSDVSGYDFSQLLYDRKTPEKGFVIKTEKREKSSAREQ